MVPPQGVRFHEDDGEDREDQQGDDFLDHFELPDREGASQLGAADAVGRDLETVFEQGDPPAEQDDGQHPEALYIQVELKCVGDLIHILGALRPVMDRQ